MNRLSLKVTNRTYNGLLNNEGRYDKGLLDTPEKLLYTVGEGKFIQR